MAPLRIEVLIAKDQLSATLRSPLRGNPKRPRMPEVQQPGRRRREPPTIRIDFGFSGHCNDERAFLNACSAVEERRSSAA
jgi:hypothetical protein